MTMCAILGTFSNSSFRPNLVSRFRKALALTAHRGPDISKELFLKDALLGFNGLSIVGTKNGSQPFSNENSTVFLLCNGEIYNYHDLWEGLKNKHQFVTESDCEVILHLYEEDPNNFSSKLRGQFSFLILDKNKDQLILCRDRFGINPLYYAVNQSQLFVSSEIKSILALDGSISSALDSIGLKETFFLYGPTPPRTCFQNIFQVEPGKILIFDLIKNQIIENKRYWELPKEKKLGNRIIEKGFNRLLKKAVKRRIQGDVPRAAVYLSGGLDSASIAYLLKELRRLPNAFSVTFHDKEFDESQYQKEVSNSLEIPLFSVVGDELFDSNLFQTIWHTEHPLIRTAPLPLYSLSQLTRSHGNKFVCCGEGADEMLFGYPVFAKYLSSVEDKVTDYSRLERLFSYRKMTGEDMVSDLMNNIVKDWEIDPNSIRCKQQIEIQTKLSRYLLTQQGDRQSMSHGVEQRFPFLDEDLVDFLFSIPDTRFEKFYMGKKLLRNHMSKSLPKKIVYRKKQGYLAPMDKQLYQSKLFSQLIAFSSSKKVVDVISRYFDFFEVKKLIRSFEEKTLSDVETIGLLLVVSTCILHDQFFGDTS